jgi:hypothetical protein
MNFHSCLVLMFIHCRYRLTSWVTRRRGQVGSTPASYFGGPSFKSRPENRLYLQHFWAFTLFLQANAFPVRYLVVIHPFNAVQSELLCFLSLLLLLEVVSPRRFGIAARDGPIFRSPDVTWGNLKERWCDTDRGKPKDSEKNLPRCHFFHHKSHFDYRSYDPELALRSRRLSHVSYGTAHMWMSRSRWSTAVFTSPPVDRALSWMEPV